MISSSISGEKDDDDMMEDEADEISRTELDSHANMPVVGRHSKILLDTGNRAQVSPFTPDYNSLQDVKIVDAAIQYTSPYTDMVYILVIRNA